MEDVEHVIDLIDDEGKRLPSIRPPRYMFRNGSGFRFRFKRLDGLRSRKGSSLENRDQFTEKSWLVKSEHDPVEMLGKELATGSQAHRLRLLPSVGHHYFEPFVFRVGGVRDFLKKLSRATGIGAQEHGSL